MSYLSKFKKGSNAKSEPTSGPRKTPAKKSVRTIKRFRDFDEQTLSIIEAVEPLTRLSPERVAETIAATNYVCKHDIPGAIVECGVWLGGSVLSMIEVLKQHNISDRKIYLYDTFTGMSKPSEADSHNGRSASELLEQGSAEDLHSIWCRGPIEMVQEIIEGSGYPMENVVFVKGKVEDTIPETMPREIALLRLDTDWYESTAHEMEHLYPLLVRQGLLIIDDYGHWDGARKAVDEYFAKLSPPPFLSRTDNTGRVCQKF